MGECQVLAIKGHTLLSSNQGAYIAFTVFAGCVADVVLSGCYQGDLGCHDFAHGVVCNFSTRDQIWKVFTSLANVIQAGCHRPCCANPCRPLACSPKPFNFGTAGIWYSMQNQVLKAGQVLG